MKECDCQGVGHTPWCRVGKKREHDELHKEIARLTKGQEFLADALLAEQKRADDAQAERDALALKLSQRESIASRDHGAPIETAEKLRAEVERLQAILVAQEQRLGPKLGDDPVAVANRWNGNSGTREPDFDMNPEDTASFLAAHVIKQDADLASTESRLVDMEIRCNSALQSLAQRDKDWDALLVEIALTVGDKDDREAAEMGEVDEIDPWHALRRHRELAARKEQGDE